MANIQITGLVEDTSPSATDVLVKEDSGGISTNKTPLQYVATAPQVNYMYKAATELTISLGAITVTQSAHKLQPETGTSDDLATISGTVDGESGILFITDEGTDTITIKHGTGNIDIVGGSDLDLSNGAVSWYSDGTTIYVIGGGGGGGGGGGINDNLLINGGFRVAQRGTSFISTTTPANSDDTYLLDRWVLLSDGNDIVDVSQESSVIPTGAHNAIKLEVETINKQFGILQILEGKDAAAIIGGTASLSFGAKMAAADDNTHSLKAVVLAWNGTEDVVTSDVVSAWGATPSYVANWTAENTPSSNTLTTSWQTFSIENISIDTASAKNVAVFIFCDQTDGAIDDAMYISQVKLESGASATDYKSNRVADETNICQRYFERVGERASNTIAIGIAQAQSATISFCTLTYSEKRSVPSIVIVDPTGFAVSNAAGAAQTCASFNATIGVTEKRARIRPVVSSGLVAGDAAELVKLSSSDGYIDIVSEL